jgi:hypothetical protein
VEKKKKKEEKIGISKPRHFLEGNGRGNKIVRTPIYFQIMLQILQKNGLFNWRRFKADLGEFCQLVLDLSHALDLTWL